MKEIEPKQAPKQQNWLKEKLLHLLRDYFGEARILWPAILLSGSLFTAEILLWRLDMIPAVYPSLFYLNTALGALVGYYLSRDSTSKMRLAVSALIGVVAAAAYYHWSDSLIGVSFFHILQLVLSQFFAMGGIFSAIRILMKLGFH
jgi:hypothetical protein